MHAAQLILRVQLRRVLFCPTAVPEQQQLAAWSRPMDIFIRRRRHAWEGGEESARLTLYHRL